MICRKAHVMLPEANFPFPDATFPSSRAQNRDFCALFAFGTLVFGLFEHKIGIFVSERAIFPWFLPLPSTKSAFLCFFGKRLRDYVSAIKRKQGELPCYSFVHLSGRRYRYASELEPAGKAAVLSSTPYR